MKLLDKDGENKAVRWFLACYGGGGSNTIGTMKLHLEMSGFDGCWPEWCNTEHPSAHLTKRGAQLWIRHLFSLEAQQVAVPQAMENLNGVTVCCGDFAKCHRPCTPRGQWMATKAYDVSVPPGYAIVPIEITEEMHIAAVKTLMRCTGNADFPPRVYRAMLAAAQGAKPVTKPDSRPQNCGSTHCSCIECPYPKTDWSAA